MKYIIWIITQEKRAEALSFPLSLSLSLLTARQYQVSIRLMQLTDPVIVQLVPEVDQIAKCVRSNS